MNKNCEKIAVQTLTLEEFTFYHHYKDDDNLAKLDRQKKLCPIIVAIWFLSKVSNEFLVDKK